MHRRHFLQRFGAGLAGGFAYAESLLPNQTEPPPNVDYTLRIQPVTLELGPKQQIKTIGYNGTSPGPILKVPEGKSVCIEVFNETDVEDIVHWHGLEIPSDVDGSVEEGTPSVPAHGRMRYSFIAQPSGTRWYHSHMSAGRNLNRSGYTGQFGFFHIEPRNDPGDYDAEFFLAIKDWKPFWTTQMGNGDSLDVGYQRYSINDRSLGYGEPLRVKQGQRILLRILNASATLPHRVAFAGHRFRVVALDGNPVPAPQEVETLELGPAERVDAQVSMDSPGVWMLGSTDERERKLGLGVVVEYSGKSGSPAWSEPNRATWDYTIFGVKEPKTETTTSERIPLVFRKKTVSSRWQDYWTVNGKQFPHTDPIRVQGGHVYRLIFDNQSDEAHPIHLHRHTFELVNVCGVPVRGVRKDVVMTAAKSQVEVELTANNPGPTLFHCHNQMHMDFGFKTMLQYV